MLQKEGTRRHTRSEPGADAVCPARRSCMRQQEGRPARPKIGAWRLLLGVHVQRYTHNQATRLVAMPGGHQAYGLFRRTARAYRRPCRTGSHADRLEASRVDGASRAPSCIERCLPDNIAMEVVSSICIEVVITVDQCGSRSQPRLTRARIRVEAQSRLTKSRLTKTPAPTASPLRLRQSATRPSGPTGAAAPLVGAAPKAAVRPTASAPPPRLLGVEASSGA